MQEQNFEKQVKEKMEELSVAPSAPVWMKVEEQIRQKRSRRRIFFWLFPIGFLLAGLITWSVINNNDNPVVNRNSKVNESISPEKNNSEKTNAPLLTTQSNENQNPPQENKTNQEAVITIMNHTDLNEKLPAKPANKPILSAQINNRNNSFVKIDKKNNTISTPEKNDVVLQPDKTLTDVQRSDNPVLSNTSSDTIISPAVATLETTQEPLSTEENKIAEIKKPSAKTRWTMSPYLSIGVSSIQYGYGSMDKNVTQFNASPASPGIGSGFPPMQTAAEPTNGASIRLGLEFMKPLNKRLNFNAGAGYYYASTHIQVGQSVEADTMFGTNSSRSVMVDQYYRAGKIEKYTNRFHFIEIPVGINWQVNKKIPLQLETGISIAQLIASNALTFDGSGNYYENIKLLYKTQFAFNGALNYRLFSIKEKSFYAGPYFKYHLTQMEKNNSGQYLFSAGLGMKLKF
jgi:hypothetical protein